MKLTHDVSWQITLMASNVKAGRYEHVIYVNISDIMYIYYVST